MNALILLIIVVVIVAVVVAFMRSRSQPQHQKGESDPSIAPHSQLAAGGFSLRPPLADFHVESGDAHVYFDVPLPDGDPDPVLTNILLAAAVETLREKRSHLPLQGVNVVHAHGVRNGQKASAGSITLDGPGQLPDAREIAALEVQTESDLFESLAGAPAQAAPPDAVAEDTLGPLGEELQLTGSVGAALRTQGIDPATSSTADLVAGLLRLGGYTVPADAGTTFTATRAGARTYVSVVEHESGGHPTLAESAVNQFLAQFSQSGASQGLLFTPKYGPFLIYEKERREKRVRFITRERFQTFVNSIAVG